jgi:hypothetical protein
VNGAELTAVVSAGASAFGAILAVLLLSFRVGSLVGTVRGFMAASDADRSKLHAESTIIESKIDGHIAWHGSGRR